MNKFLATDLDGTLLYPKSRKNYVCKENKKTIDLFNNQVIIVSGRNQQFIKGICDEINIPHTFIACNGAIVYVNGKKISTSCLDTNIIKSIIEFIENNCKDYFLIFFDDDGNLYSIFDNEKLVKEKEDKAFNAYPKLGCRTDKNPKHLQKIFKENRVVKLNLNVTDIDTPIVEKYLKENFPHLSLALCRHSIEVTNKGINKGESLKSLTDTLNVNPDNVYVIGDDGNDVSMFKIYKNSFLVKNKKNHDLIDKAKYALDKFCQLKDYMEE